MLQCIFAKKLPQLASHLYHLQTRNVLEIKKIARTYWLSKSTLIYNTVNRLSPPKPTRLKKGQICAFVTALPASDGVRFSILKRFILISIGNNLASYTELYLALS